MKNDFSNWSFADIIARIRRVDHAFENLLLERRQLVEELERRYPQATQAEKDEYFRRQNEQ